MKRIITAIVIFAVVAAFLVSCGNTAPITPTDSTQSTPSATKDTEPTEKPDEPPVVIPDDPAETVVGKFKESASKTPDASAENIAKTLISLPYFKYFNVWEANSYCPGFDFSFKPGTSDAAYMIDSLSSEPNIVFVFKLGEGQTAKELEDSLKANVNMDWNYMDTPADYTLCADEGAFVLFMVYSDSVFVIDDSPVAMTARELVEMFKSYRAENPDADSLDIAEYLAAHQRVGQLYTRGVEEGHITGFFSEIHGFAECATFSPMMMPSTFIGYIFKVENSSDVDAFVQKIRAEANVAWNVCVVVNTVITDTSDNFVIFMMCNE